MSTTITFVLERDIAINKVRTILTDAHYSITNEKAINNGYGYKYFCESFGVVLYFKAGKSSKIVLENAPEELNLLFEPQQYEKKQTYPEQNETTPLTKTIPIHLAIRIATQTKQEEIKSAIKAKYKNIEESKPREAINYKFDVMQGTQRFSITQFTNGTLLLQGASSPLFTEILGIVHSINPLSEIENALIYVPEREQKQVKKAIEEIPKVFSDIYQRAQERISRDAFDYLYQNDQITLVSAIGILEAVKEKDLKIPLYNPILYPFAKTFEGFIIRLMIDKCFISFEDYKQNPNKADIGNCLRNKKFEKYIKDLSRNGFVLNKLNTVWESIRCHELHADPAQDDDIVNLQDIMQVENRIGEISSAIMDGYRILVKNGYTESEILQRKEIHGNQKPKEQTRIQSATTTEKIIPVFKKHIGTDESGKGDYFGPLVIAGVLLDKIDEEKLVSIGVQDSKKNTDNKNRELATQIRDILGNKKYEIIFILPEKYNELYSRMKNLNLLLAWGHARVIEYILSHSDCEHAIADQFGDESYIKKALMEKGKKIELFQTPKGERDVAVAAASILARDMYLKQLKLLSKKASIDLPKGASSEVESVARSIIQNKGKDKLNCFAKLHFKTTEKVLK